MRKELTLYGSLMLLSFTMGLFTCRTCSRPPVPAAPPARVDTVNTVVHDSVKVTVPVPVRVTVPTLAEGRIPDTIFCELPIYMPADTVAIIEQYKAMYPDYAALREYDHTYPFGSDTVRVKGSVQGNRLQAQEVFLAHADKVLTVRPKPRNSLWWGASSYWRGTELGVGSNIMFQHKRGFAIEAGASIGTSGLPTYSGGLKWKIGKRY